MKVDENHQLLTTPFPLSSLREPGARGHPCVLEVQKPFSWRYRRQLLSKMSSQPVERKVLSWGVIRQSAGMLAEIMMTDKSG
jgi:hypothetical protein